MLLEADILQVDVKNRGAMYVGLFMGSFFAEGKVLVMRRWVRNSIREQRKKNIISWAMNSFYGQT